VLVDTVARLDVLKESEGHQIDDQQQRGDQREFDAAEAASVLA